MTLRFFAGWAQNGVSGGRLLKALGISIVFCIVLAEVMRLVHEVSSWNMIYVAALIHGFIGIGWVNYAKSHEVAAISFGVRIDQLVKRLRFAPPFLIVVVVVIAGMLTSDGIQAVPWTWALVLSVTLIPIVEEWVYRVGLSSVLQKFLPGFWGIYVSALAFSWMHSQPSVERIVAGETGLFLGPFLLAIVCDLLYRVTKKISVAIALHISCNLTVVIFTATDSRWFDWLHFLYLESS